MKRTICTCLKCGKQYRGAYMSIVCNLCTVKPQTMKGGTYVGSHPYEKNEWWLKCCPWGATPHLDDPRTIEPVRLAAFALAAISLATGAKHE